MDVYGSLDGAMPGNPPWDPQPSQLRVLVTGASGLLGRPLVGELAARDIAVFSISSTTWEKLHPKVQALFATHRVHHQPLDLAQDAEAGGACLRRIIGAHGFDLVINLAADRGGVRYDGVVKRMNDDSVNALLPKVLAEITYGVRAPAGWDHLPMIQVSSEYVWSGEGNTPRGYPPVQVPTLDYDVDAGSGAGPAADDLRQMFVKDSGAPYAVQKRKGEQFVAGYSNVHIYRVGVLYGDVLNALEDGTAGGSIDNFLGENTWLHDTWQNRYPTAAGDCAFILAAMALKCCKWGLDKPVYNFGAQESVSKYQFMRMFAEATGLNLDEIATCDARDVAASKGTRLPPCDVKLNIEETRSELLSMPGDVAWNWREPSELDVLTVLTTWLPHFADRVQAKRPPEYKPDARLCQRIVQDLRLRVPGPVVAVIGSRMFMRPDTEDITQKIASRIPAALGDLEAVFLTGGMPGVQATFASALDESTRRTRLVNIVSAKCDNVISSGQEFIAGVTLPERVLVMGLVGDVYLTLEGGPGVAQEAAGAIARGAAVLPVIRTGGASGGLFGFPAEALGRPAIATEEQWRLVQSQDADADETADAVVTLLARYVAQTGQATPEERVTTLFRKFDRKRRGFMSKDTISKLLIFIMPKLNLHMVENMIDAAGVGPDAPSADIDYGRLIQWIFSDE